MEMVRLKYLGHKEQGLPVTFPVGCKQKSGWHKIVWAAPFIDVSADEAALLLKDSRNWAKAEGAELKLEIENEVKEIAKPKAHRASVAKAEAAAKAAKRRGRPKEYGQPKADPVVSAETTPVEAPEAVESEVSKPAKKKKH